ncbi:hypothetical protein VNO80_20990 [Phaseolus coccineus]|uniref:Uncharacterized protein n=1 Tax=Phaseolus coccineus TaxID=3886 RepID=A0AAN9M1L3_PHACN
MSDFRDTSEYTVFGDKEYNRSATNNNLLVRVTWTENTQQKLKDMSADETYWTKGVAETVEMVSMHGWLTQHEFAAALPGRFFCFGTQNQ